MLMQGSSTPATSFPAPPPPPPPPRRNSCCCKVWSFMIMTAIICLGVIIYICIERFTPKRPLFRLDSLSLTNFSASSSSESVTGTWQIGFLVQNANKKKTVNYDALRCSLFYSESDDDEYGFRLVSDHAPFKQGPISETTLNVTLSAVNAHVNDPRVANGINTEWARDGSVAFNVKVVAHISFQYGSWSFLQDLNFLWTKVPVAISSNTSSGNLVGGQTRPILEY